jgi:hypothetical protein
MGKYRLYGANERKFTRPRSPTVCVKILRNWRRGQGPTTGCRAIDEWMNESKYWLVVKFKNCLSVLIMYLRGKLLNYTDCHNLPNFNNVPIENCLTKIFTPGSSTILMHVAVLLSQIWDFPNLEGRSPYLYPSGTGWPSYTPRHWVPFSSPPTTRMATVEVLDPSSTRDQLSRIQSQSHITTDCQTVCLSWCRAPAGAHDQMFLLVWKLLSCPCGAPFLTRGRVCHLSVIVGSALYCTYTVALQELNALSRIGSWPSLYIYIYGRHGPHRKHRFHYCMFSRCQGNSVSPELFPRNGCYTVAYLHSHYLAQ